MHNKLGRKVLHGVVMLSMVLSLAPVFSGANVAQAAVPTMACSDVKPGMFLKVEGKPAIFGMSSTGATRFWGEGYVAKSWFAAYKDMNYKYVTQDCIRSLATPKASPYGMAISPGMGIVKYDEFDQLYVVLPGNAVAPVSVDVAKALYGANYTVQKVGLREWPDQALCKKNEYKDKLPSPGSVVKVGSMYYWVNYGKKLHEITANGMSANRKLMSLVRVWPESVKTSFTMGDKVDGYLAMIGDVHQEGWDCNVDPVMGTWTQPTGVITPPTSTIPGSSLSVSGESVAPERISDGTAYNKFLKLSFTSGNTDVRVKGLTITKTGVSDNTKISGISVWDTKGHRYGDVISSVNSNNQVTIGFASDPLLVGKGNTETLYISFSVSSTMNSGTLGASIKASTDIMTDAAEVRGTFPLSSRDASVFDGSGQLASYTVTAVSPGGNSSSGSAGNVAVGDKREIAKFKFTNNSTNNNDITVKNITFYLEGTIKERDFTNYELVAPDNTVLGKTVYSSNRYITINLDKPYTVPRSQNRTLSLQAQVDNGSGNWIRVHVQNDYDVMVTDEATKYDVIPASFSDAVASDGYFSVKSGTINITKSPDSPSGSISAGASDIVLGRFDVTAVGEDMEIRKMGIVIASSGPKMVLTGNVNIRVLDKDGKPEQTLLSFSAADDGILYQDGSQRNLTAYWILKAGETRKLEVLGSVNTTATSTSYQVGIGKFYAKRLSTLDFADNIPTTSPSSTLANQLTVQATNLTITKDTTLGNKNIGTSGDFIVGQYVARASNAEDVRLTNLTVKFTGTVSAPDDLQNMEVWAYAVENGVVSATGTKLGSTISAPATSSNSFAFDLSIAKNTQKVLKVKVYAKSSASGTVITQVDSFNYVGASTQNVTTDSTSDPTGQTMTVSAANLVITAASDSTTISTIKTPSGDTPVQVGKWKLEAQNEAVRLDRLTLWNLRPAAATAVNTSAAEFGAMSLWDADNMGGEPLATGNYVGGVGKGYVQFVKTGIITIPKDGIKYLVLKSTINGSGTMTVATTSAWGWMSSELTGGGTASTGTTYLEARTESGSLLGSAAIDIGSAGVAADSDTPATSTFSLYHNAVPVVTAQTISGGLSISSRAPIFKFKIENKGDRELRIGSITSTISVSGLQSSTAGLVGVGTVGTISAFELWEAGADGSPLTRLATNTMSVAYNNAAASGCIAGSRDVTVSGHGACVNGATSTLNVQFSATNDFNNYFDNLTVSVNGSRTFIVTADTQNVAVGRTAAGTVTVSGRITNSSGVSRGDTSFELDWADGSIQYYYTPTAGSENSTAYVAIDGGDILGNSLQVSI